MCENIPLMLATKISPKQVPGWWVGDLIAKRYDVFRVGRGGGVFKPINVSIRCVEEFFSKFLLHSKT